MFCKRCSSDNVHTVEAYLPEQELFVKHRVCLDCACYCERTTSRVREFGNDLVIAGSVTE